MYRHRTLFRKGWGDQNPVALWHSPPHHLLQTAIHCRRHAIPPPPPRGSKMAPAPTACCSCGCNSNRLSVAGLCFASSVSTIHRRALAGRPPVPPQLNPQPPLKPLPEHQKFHFIKEPPSASELGTQNMHCTRSGLPYQGTHSHVGVKLPEQEEEPELELGLTSGKQTSCLDNPTLIPPPPPCDIPSGCCFFTGSWTVTRSSLRMLHQVAAFYRPLRPVLLLVSFPRSRSPVVGVLGLCPPPPTGKY